MGTIRVARYIGSIATMAILFSACATAAPGTRVPNVTRARARSGGAERTRSDEHIYVTGDTLDSACYKEVGEVSYVEPFERRSRTLTASVSRTNSENHAVDNYRTRWTR